MNNPKFPLGEVNAPKPGYLGEMPLPDFPVCDTPHKLAYIAEHPLPFAQPCPKCAAPATCIEPQQLARQAQVSGTK